MPEHTHPRKRHPVDLSTSPTGKVRTEPTETDRDEQYYTAPVADTMDAALDLLERLENPTPDDNDRPFRPDSVPLTVSSAAGSGPAR